MENRPESRNSESGPYLLLSDAQFASLGVNQIAYVKPVTGEDGDVVYEVHSAEGSVLAEIADLAVAFATVRENNMEPLSVH